jgi:hypothetical protein
MDRLNVSLNSIQDGTLKIRTILEMKNEDIFLNPAAAKAIVKYAKQTTAQDPLLPIPEHDCWQYLNAVLNEISERFAVGTMRRDVAWPVAHNKYLLCLTCEAAGDVRTRKVRAMLVRKTLVEKGIGMFVVSANGQPKYESHWHETRWETLKIMAVQYNKNPHRFIEMEICV